MAEFSEAEVARQRAELDAARRQAAVWFPFAIVGASDVVVRGPMDGPVLLVPEGWLDPTDNSDQEEPLMPWPTGEKQFEPGDQLTDIVSGWTGTVVARYEYMNGCVRYEIAGADKDGKPDSYVFDEQQLTPYAMAAIPRGEPEPPRPTGGPRDSRPVPR